MAEKQHQITVQDTGTTFVCGEGEPILSAMKRAYAGPIHYGCFGGGCGVCKMKVVAGDVYQAKRMSRAHVSPQEEQAGTRLLCCIHPRSDVVIAGV